MSSPFSEFTNTLILRLLISIGGHTLVSLLTEGATPLHKVTILPRGPALGFTSMVRKNDDLNHTKRGLLAMMDVSMGGRVAEEIYLGPDDYSSGWSSDIKNATNIAYAYVRQVGMSDENIISAGLNETS